MRHKKLAWAGGIIGGLIVIGVSVGTAGCSHSSSDDTAVAVTDAPTSPDGVPEISSPPPAPVATHKSAAAGSHRPSCDASLWNHVYHSYRLHVYAQCKTVTGVVDAVRREDDGDLHIDLNTGGALVNSVNYADQHGDLVLEEICVGTVTQADAVAACSGFTNRATVPSQGDQVQATGSYVLDADHGWMEIHPVTSLTVLGHPGSSAGFAIAPKDTPAPAASPAHTAAPVQTAVSCHPLTSGGNCYEPGEFCPKADAGMIGVAGDGKTITCTQDGTRWRWE